MHAHKAIGLPFKQRTNLFVRAWQMHARYNIPVRVVSALINVCVTHSYLMCKKRKKQQLSACDDSISWHVWHWADIWKPKEMLADEELPQPNNSSTQRVHGEEGSLRARVMFYLECQQKNNAAALSSFITFAWTDQQCLNKQAQDGPWHLRSSYSYSDLYPF